MATRTRKSTPLVQPLTVVRDGFALIVTYPVDTKLAQMGTEWTHDYQRMMHHDGKRWILRSFNSELGTARFWSPDLKSA